MLHIYIAIFNIGIVCVLRCVIKDAMAYTYLIDARSTYFL